MVYNFMTHTRHNVVKNNFSINFVKIRIKTEYGRQKSDTGNPYHVASLIAADSTHDDEQRLDGATGAAAAGHAEEEEEEAEDDEGQRDAVEKVVDVVVGQEGTRRRLGIADLGS